MKGVFFLIDSFCSILWLEMDINTVGGQCIGVTYSDANETMMKRFWSRVHRLKSIALAFCYGNVCNKNHALSAENTIRGSSGWDH